MTRDEKIMLGTMGFALALWVSSVGCWVRHCMGNNSATTPFVAGGLVATARTMQRLHMCMMNSASACPAQICAQLRTNWLQVCGDMVGISAVVAAMLGLSVLLLTGVLTWRDCLTYPPAWDTLFWFAVLVGAPFTHSRVRPGIRISSACSALSTSAFTTPAE